MALTRTIGWVFVAAAPLVLAACGGGGSPGDVHPGTDPVIVPGEPNAFLLFPNPQVQPDRSLQTNTPAYAQAYYVAIDPNNTKDTLAKWRAANGFDTATGTQVTVVFGDSRDLGFGRRFTARQNPDGTLAFYVENYLIKTGGVYAFSPVNLEAAIVRDPNALVYVAGIEFSPGPAGGVSFAKFYNFNVATGARENMADIDGRGDKAMPGPCIACHGGRADALTPPDASGNPRFNLLLNAVSGTRGDVMGQLPPFEVASFQFSTDPGFTRADQEPLLKTMNKWVLCSYPLPAPSAFPEDACRRAASSGEWQGTAAALIKAAYGGDGLPNLTYVDPPAPASWASSGQTSLYETVHVPACRGCHQVRGTGRQSDIDFATYAKFQSYAQRIFATVVDRGNMPLAKLVYDTFHASSSEAALADFLVGQGLPARDASANALRPGRPIADPGPDRVVRQGATQLSARNSLYADTYAWSIVSGPNGAAGSALLTNANTAQPTFSATTDGTYVLNLVASNTSAHSAPKLLSLVVQSTLSPAPSAIRFSDIKAALQDGTECKGCHAPASPLHPPIAFTNYDRDGDGVITPTDDAWFYAEVRSRINFEEIAASALLQKPSGNYHFGGLGPGFDTSLAPGQPGRAKYDLFLNWILNGAPQ